MHDVRRVDTMVVSGQPCPPRRLRELRDRHGDAAPSRPAASSRPASFLPPRKSGGPQGVMVHVAFSFSVFEILHGLHAVRKRPRRNPQKLRDAAPPAPLQLLPPARERESEGARHLGRAGLPEPGPMGQGPWQGPWPTEQGGREG